MPAPRSQQAQIDAANENILVLVGRLLEATTAASDGLKTLSEASRQNGATAQSAQQSVDALQRTVAELDRIVRTGNGESLVVMARLAVDAAERIRDDHDELSKVVEANTKRVEALERAGAVNDGGHVAVWYVAGVVAWLVTTAIAIYAAIKGK